MAETTTSERPTWKAVAIPAEHGGWGLTLEPGLLGLLVAPSWAGLCLAAAAMLAFVMRTPLKVVAVDRRRGRRLARTDLASRTVVGEGAVLLALVVGAALLAERATWWVPLAVAAPLVAVEAWYDVRSRGRRLVPEVLGAVAVASVAAAIAIAGGEPGVLAASLWAVLTARIVTSIPHVRAQISRLHERPVDRRTTLVGDTAASALAVVAVLLEPGVAAGAITVVAVIAVQIVRRRRPLAPVKVIGVLQMVMGFAVVGATALGLVLFV